MNEYANKYLDILYLLINVDIPSQVLPSPFNTYPVLQVHVYEPSLSVQTPFVASQGPGEAAHSSTSKFKKRNDEYQSDEKSGFNLEFFDL